MLHSYEAIYENGQLKWLNDQPDVTHSRVIVTILPKSHTSPEKPKRRFPVPEAGEVEIVGDIVSPIVDEENV
jgi:hypothetical protein